MIEVKRCIECSRTRRACKGDYIKPNLSSRSNLSLESKFYQISSITENEVVLNGTLIVPIRDIRSFDT